PGLSWADLHPELDQPGEVRDTAELEYLAGRRREPEPRERIAQAAGQDAERVEDRVRDHRQDHDRHEAPASEPTLGEAPRSRCIRRDGPPPEIAEEVAAELAGGAAEPGHDPDPERMQEGPGCHRDGDAGGWQEDRGADERLGDEQDRVGEDPVLARI